jgi:hypothetical protein
MAKKNGNGKNGSSVVNLGAGAAEILGATIGSSMIGMAMPFATTKPGIIGAAEGSKQVRKILDKKGK